MSVLRQAYLHSPPVHRFYINSLAIFYLNFSSLSCRWKYIFMMNIGVRSSVTFTKIYCMHCLSMYSNVGLPEWSLKSELSDLSRDESYLTILIFRKRWAIYFFGEKNVVENYQEILKNCRKCHFMRSSRILITGIRVILFTTALSCPRPWSGSKSR